MSVHDTIITSTSPRVTLMVKPYFPGLTLRRMPLTSNVKELLGYQASAPKENRDMIQHDLYSNKQIPSYWTVENDVSRLSLKTKHKGIQAIILKEYEGIANKYKHALPTTGRIKRQLAEKRNKVQSRVVSITLILFRKAKTGDAKQTTEARRK